MRKYERETLTLFRKLFGDVEVIRRNKGGHLVIVIDGKVKTTIAHSPSDYRSNKNAVSVIRRLLS